MTDTIKNILSKKLGLDDTAIANLETKTTPSGRYVIPVNWTINSTITVEGKNLADAIATAFETKDRLPIDDDNEYLEDSYQIAIANEQSAIDTLTLKPIGSVYIDINKKIHS